MFKSQIIIETYVNAKTALLRLEGLKFTSTITYKAGKYTFNPSGIVLSERQMLEAILKISQELNSFTYQNATLLK